MKRTMRLRFEETEQEVISHQSPVGVNLLAWFRGNGELKSRSSTSSGSPLGPPSECFLISINMTSPIRPLCRRAHHSDKDAGSIWPCHPCGSLQWQSSSFPS